MIAITAFGAIVFLILLSGFGWLILPLLVLLSKLHDHGWFKPETRKPKLATALALAALLSGCSAGFITELAKDSATLCARSTVIYGGFAISPAPAAPAIGVRVDNEICRSNNPGGAVVRMTPQGDISILHGPVRPEMKSDTDKESAPPAQAPKVKDF
jgi:hypothetical protein